MQGSLTTSRRWRWCLVKSWMLVILIYILSGCHLQQQTLRFITSSDLNANSVQQGMSVLVHIYLLSDLSAWQTLNFHQVTVDSHFKTFSFILKQQQVLLEPSATRYVHLDSQPGAKGIAVVAFFHHPQLDAWSVIFPLHHPRLGSMVTKTMYLNRNSIMTHH